MQSFLQRTCRDHPRRCGENSGLPSVKGRVVGSPPQVRGKPCSNAPQQRRYRITPAGAGKTIRLNYDVLNAKDHPRRCGENLSGRLLPVGALGSPPQVRGKQDSSTQTAVMLRITPAGAGKTGLPQGHQPQNGDHPRRCGENRLYQALFAVVVGSPPQVRGKPTVYA